MFFSPSNLKEMSDRAKQMTPIEIILAVLTGMFWTLYGFGYFVIRVMNGSYGILLGMMRGIYFNKKIHGNKFINVNMCSLHQTPIFK